MRRLLECIPNSSSPVMSNVRRQESTPNRVRDTSIKADFDVPDHLCVRTLCCNLFSLLHHSSHRIVAQPFGWCSVVCPRARCSSQPDLDCRSILCLWILGGIRWIVLYHSLHGDPYPFRLPANLRRRGDWVVHRGSPGQKSASGFQAIIVPNHWYQARRCKLLLSLGCEGGVRATANHRVHTEPVLQAFSNGNPTFPAR